MKGGPLHLDEAGQQFQNLLASDRANTWQAHGARAGIIDGADVSPNAVELGVDITEFDALVQAVISGAPRQQGWYVWNDITETVLFDTPSADPRVDALVCAVRAPDLGTIPVGTSAGPQWVTVAGTPHATTPQAPDAAAIDDAVGPGGWFRWRDVTINPGDTVIAPGNVGPLLLDSMVDTDWITLPAPQALSLISTTNFPPRIRRKGYQVWLNGSVQPTTASGGLGHGANWQHMWDVDPTFRPTTLWTGAAVAGPEVETAADGANIGLRATGSGAVDLVNSGNATVPSLMDINLTMFWLTD